MDNIKTGSLIKELRKEKNMTQKELADLLHITDRAVSKWERGLCAPDISTLEPLATILEVTVIELISGTRIDTQEYVADIDCAVKNVLSYSENEIVQKTKALKKKIVISAVSVCVLLLFLIPTLNGLIGGNGFAWKCIPAYMSTRKAAEAITAYDEQAIQTHLGNSDGVFDELSDLKEQGIRIWDWDAKFSRTRLDDMFLIVEVDFIVLYQDIKYQFTCKGTYRNGKVEFMNIVPTGVGKEYPEWILQLSDALSTYNPG